MTDDPEQLAATIADLLDEQQAAPDVAANALLRVLSSLVVAQCHPEDYAAAVGDFVLHLSATLLEHANSAEALDG